MMEDKHIDPNKEYHSSLFDNNHAVMLLINPKIGEIVDGSPAVYSFFQQLFQNSPEAIAILDNEDRVICINKRFKQLFQYSMDEMKDRFIKDMIVPKNYIREARTLSKEVMAGGFVKKETVRKKKDDTRIDVAILAYPIIHNEEQMGVYAIYTDITERKEIEKKIKHLAITDSLTGLYNRSFFMDRLDTELSNAQKSNKALAVMFIDIDGFKSMNDNLGHVIGDKILITAAERINNCINKDSIVARMGGDEFTILLPNVNGTYDATHVAERMINSFRQPIYIGERKFYITISIGMALYPIDGEDTETLIKNADIALYEAKEYSGNRYEFYTSSLNKKIEEEFMIENDLRHALERNEFSLYYQPIVNLEKNKIVGAEALIRWNHPVFGNIPPDKFIPIAEKRGFIGDIGEWVLRTACSHNKKWQDMGHSWIFVAVNISVKQLEQNGFIDLVTKILKETNLDPQYVELEITESISMKNVKNRVAILQELKNLGIRLSIDDFGTGYSSLGQLKKLAISKLKIDRSFINDINVDNNNTAIVSTIIAIAKTLNLYVVAEGVETKEQLQFLSKEKCEMVQGYLYSPPVPTNSFEELLAKF